MNRRQFMKELGSGLFESIREAAAPLVEKDLEKLCRWADRWSGFEYHPLAVPEDGRFEERIIAGERIFIHQWDGEWAVYSGRCPVCGQLLHYLSYSPRLKCFGCDLEHGLGPDTLLIRFPIRQKSGKFVVGLPRREGFHA